MLKKHSYFICLFTYCALIAACSRSDAPARINYPDTATVDHVDNYHGHDVADPYRWAFLVRNLDMRLPEGYAE